MNSLKIKFLLLSLCLSLILTASLAQARVYVDVNKPMAKKLPMAIPDFVPLDPTWKGNSGTATGLVKMMGANLDLTGIFTILDKRTFLEQNKRAGLENLPIEYKQWRMVGSELLIKGAYGLSGDTLTLELRLFDVFEKRMLLGKRYTGEIREGRAMVNRFLNETMMTITGERGVFESRIAFVGKKPNGNKEIYIARFGRRDVFQVTNNGSINLSPVFSADGQSLAYISYKSRRPRLYIRNIKERIEKRFTSGKNLLLSPSFTTFGDILVTISRSSNSNIFLLDKNGARKRQLTNSWGINISPTISPDGKNFAFVSDRSGRPQIYISDLQGGEPRRITFEGKMNTDPQWSPRGDRLVYVSSNEGRFGISTIKPDGTDNQTLTTNEADSNRPSWSPDGRIIVFASTRHGSSRLFTMTANGERQRPLDLNFKGSLSTPFWSPTREE